MKFTDYLNKNLYEHQIYEGAGSLSGLPKRWIKEIVSGGTFSLGGENSEIKLYKSNAKQKDLTAALKMCGGFVAPGDRGNKWSLRQSKAEIEAAANKNSHAGVLVKINYDWAFMALYDEYNPNPFRLITYSGENKSVKRQERLSVKRAKLLGKSFINFDDKNLKATELSDFIDFKEDIVEIYLVTSDVERELKRQERAAERNSISKVSPERKAALVKFLNSKSENILDGFKQDFQDSIDALNKRAENLINSSISGKDIDSSDINDILKTIKEKYESLSNITYYIRDIIKDGGITKLYNNEKTYAYKRFLTAIDELKKTQ